MEVGDTPNREFGYCRQNPVDKDYAVEVVE
jgi:hypothetical protein